MSDAQICQKFAIIVDFNSRKLKAAEKLGQAFAIKYDQPHLTLRNFTKNFMEDLVQALVVNRQCG